MKNTEVKKLKEYDRTHSKPIRLLSNAPTYISDLLLNKYVKYQEPSLNSFGDLCTQDYGKMRVESELNKHKFIKNLYIIINS